MNVFLSLRRTSQIEEKPPPEQVDLPPVANGAHQATAALAAKAATAGLMLALALGPVGAVAGGVALTRSAGPAPAQATGVVEEADDRAVAGEFALRVVVTWLTTTRDNPDALVDLVKDPAIPGLGATPFTVAHPSVARVVPVGGVWSVTVAVTVTDARASTQRRYYQVPVRVAGGSVTALTLPSLVSPPAVLAGSASQYRTQVGATSPLGATVVQFLTAYLAGSGDLSRYLTPGVSLTALTPAPYTTVRLEDLRTTNDTDPATVPRDGARLRVLAGGTASVTEQQTSPVAYALTLTARAGRWEITAIDPTPVAPSASGPAGSPTAGPAPARPSGSAPPTQPTP